MAKKKELINLNVRIPKTLRELLEKYVERDLHTNISEFCRDALREKLARDAPDLARLLFQGEQNNGQ
jgi:Arc/MetJ-type ribon-helix-helix transcriptional regulator